MIDLKRFWKRKIKNPIERVEKTVVRIYRKQDPDDENLVGYGFMYDVDDLDEIGQALLQMKLIEKQLLEDIDD